ncbi:MAG: DUF1800 domain-containing protein [Pseudomonadales bacterium]|nr:DUF1800 domain-containing protein [Pseudomonadales bacterium]
MSLPDSVLLRFPLLLLVLCTSCSVLAMAPEDAVHLLKRTGFGVTETEYQAMLPLSREEGVAQLVNGMKQLPVSRAPGFLPTDKNAGRNRGINAGRLTSWWLREMIRTPSPLTERMTLFWHGHFTSDIRKVNSALLMFRQNLLFRRLGTTRFDDLLHAVIRDGAMLKYLDNANSRKADPNENFARELLELFTLGEGNYEEQDVVAAARSFAGWGVARDGGFLLRTGQVDSGTKRFLGVEKNFSPDDIVAEILRGDTVGVFVVGALWTAFVSPDPVPAEVARLATDFRQQGYDIKRLLKALFMTEAFWSSRDQLVRSPVELVVSSYRQLGADLKPRQIRQQLAAMGQIPFRPPDVSGWPAGADWLKGDWLLARENFLSTLPLPDEPVVNENGESFPRSARQTPGPEMPFTLQPYTSVWLNSPLANLK